MLLIQKRPYKHSLSDFNKKALREAQKLLDTWDEELKAEGKVESCKEDSKSSPKELTGQKRAGRGSEGAWRQTLRHSKAKAFNAYSAVVRVTSAAVQVARRLFAVRKVLSAQVGSARSG